MSNLSNLSKSIGGLMIGLGLTAAGAMIAGAIKSFKSADRTVIVKGLSEREVKADKVICPISFTEVGNDLKDVYTSLESKKQIVKDFLIQNGLNEEEISFSAPKAMDAKTDRYNSNINALRYNVTQTVTISSKNVDLVRDMLQRQSILLSMGVVTSTGEYQDMTQYLYTQFNDLKPAMIEEATKNARQTADKFAKDSNSSLGKIRKATQGQVVVDNRDLNTPYIKILRVVTTIEYQLEN